jgi:hypothetical protein
MPDRNVTDNEIELLQQLATPGIVPTTTREFANLQRLGLVLVQDETGVVELTPLGKAWVTSQHPVASH